MDVVVKYKMYVWKDVLCDYTSGIACVYASSLKEAIKIIIKKAESKCEDAWLWTSLLDDIIRFYNYDDGIDRIDLDTDAKNIINTSSFKLPKIIDSPDGIAIYGGG